MPSHSTNITRKSVVCGGHTEQPPELNSHHSQHVVSVLVTGLVTVLVTEAVVLVTDFIVLDPEVAVILPEDVVLLHESSSFHLLLRILIVQATFEYSFSARLVVRYVRPATCY